MGNRGGRIHDPASKTLLKRKWASKRWIICVTEFKDRQREVMGNGYTELFFLDEVSALAGGHRPCFECRRSDAKRFADTWQKTHGAIVGSVADEMDRVLHEERLQTGNRLLPAELSKLPDGAMIKAGEMILAKRDGNFRIWSGEGYGTVVDQIDDPVLLTPGSILPVLANGYEPAWHNSID